MIKSWGPDSLDEDSSYRKYLQKRIRDKHKNIAACSIRLVDYTSDALFSSDGVIHCDCGFEIVRHCFMTMQHDIELPY